MTSDPFPRTDWSALVEKIRSGEPAGMAELYDLFGRGIRFYVCRQIGRQELDDKVHDLVVTIVQSIRRGELRDPVRLMGFVRTVVRRKIAAHIDNTAQARKQRVGLDAGELVADPRNDPEQDAIDEQQAHIMEQVLRSVSARDREVLSRFYLFGHSMEKICADMNLTENQFRLLKSRAKARFVEMGRRTLEKHGREISLRAKTGSGH